MRRRHLTIVLLVLASAVPRIADAQPGAIANAAIGITASDGDAALAFSGGIGYRFNRSIGFGVELTHMPGLENELSNGIRPLALYPRYPGDDDADGHATMFTTNVRVEIPTALRHVIPYVTGGGGVAAVTEVFPVYYALAATGAVASSSQAAVLPVPSPYIYPGPQFVSNTTVAMALTLGGGTSILVTEHLAVDVDLRAFKLLGQTRRTMGRFGVGGSYRF
jgi:opacity protein-like surface antigen